MLPILWLCGLASVQAQVASIYTFSQSIGTYAPITGGTLVANFTATSGAGSMDDVIYNVPVGTIPFTFTFDGAGYTGLNISSNGFITFGSTAPTTGNYGPLSNTGLYAGAISPFGRDLQGGFVFSADRTSGSPTLTNVSSTAGVAVGDLLSGTGIATGSTVVSISGNTITMSANATSTGTNGPVQAGGPANEIRYQTLGTPGNRVFVIQWSGFKRFGTTLTTAQHMTLNFQVRLYEADNSIEIVYGNCSPGLTTLTTVNQVGLRGPNNTFATNVNNRQNTKGVNDNWLNSDPGISNTAGMVFNNVAPANVLSNGLTYRWVLPACAFPTATASVLQNCAAGTFSIQVNLTNLGDAASVNIVPSSGAPLTGITTPGSYTVGPFASGTPVSVTLTHNQDSDCNLFLGSFLDCCGGTCASALTAVVGTNFTPIMNCGNGASNPPAGSTTATHARWFRWTAPAAGTLNITSCGAVNNTNNDTRLSLWAGTCGALTNVGFNDDACAYALGGSAFASQLLGIPVSAGTTYFIEWDNRWNSNAFNWTLEFTAPPCDAPGTPSAGNIGSTSATISWAAAPGALTYDWTVGTGASCPTGSGANTAATTANLSGLIPNTTYRFCVRTSTCTSGGPAGSYVTTTFTTAPLPNDNCTGAIAVSCNSTVNGSTVGALSDAALGACGVGTGGTPGNGIWYRLAGDGSQVTLNLCNSSYDTKVHVYSGSCGALTCVASNDDSNVCSNTLRSYVVFNTTAGVDYYILVSGFGSATGAFSMSISCVCGAPLSAPWATTGIGGASGQAIDNVCGGSIDLQSNGYSSSPASDMQYLASQTLCGNQTITVRVANVTNGGFAGIAFRESTAAGSRLVGLKTQLGTFVQREIRNATNGFKNTQQLPAPGHSWLRITRNGSTFIGYHSSNGTNWQQAFVTSLALPNCVQVGLFVEGINVNSTANAVFTNVSIGASTLMAPIDAPAAAFASPLEFSLFPNPAQSEINVKMGEEFIGKEVNIRVVNQLGQTLLVRRIGEVQHQIETIPVSELPHGVYFMSLQTESGEVQTKKFVVGVNRP